MFSVLVFHQRPTKISLFLWSFRASSLIWHPAVMVPFPSIKVAAPTKPSFRGLLTTRITWSFTQWRGFTRWISRASAWWISFSWWEEHWRPPLEALWRRFWAQRMFKSSFFLIPDLLHLVVFCFEIFYKTNMMKKDHSFSFEAQPGVTSWTSQAELAFLGLWGGRSPLPPFWKRT